MGLRGTNLIRRNGTYYYRCRVPEIYQAGIGKKEIIQSLRTSDYSEARILVSAVRLETLVRFSNMADDKKDQIGQASIFIPVRNKDGEYKWGGRTTELGVKVEQAIKATTTPTPTPQASPPAPDLHKDAGKPFHAFTDAYIAKRGGDKREHQTAFKQMREVLGDKPIKDITKNDIVSVVEYMEAKKGKKGNATVSYQTIDKKLSCMRGFFRKMKGNKNLIAINPVDGITTDASPKEKEEAEDNKRPFTKAELKKIFHSPLFTGCQSLGRVYAKGDVLCRNHKFWVPVLGFYTGARISELWQLEFSDVVKKEGGWFIHISRKSNHGFEKYTKNKASIRFVPLHPDLRKIGFWDYLDERKMKSKDGRVFPKYGYGKMFNDDLLRKNLKITDYGVSFHCLRHCFADSAENAELEDSIVSRLMGHDLGTMTAKYGSKDLFKRQTNAMKKIKMLIPMNHLFK